jgi:hypothetical protein
MDGVGKVAESPQLVSDRVGVASGTSSSSSSALRSSSERVGLFRTEANLSELQWRINAKTQSNARSSCSSRIFFFFSLSNSANYVVSKKMRAAEYKG